MTDRLTRALVAGQRALSAGKHPRHRRLSPISARARRCCATSCNRECWAWAPISSCADKASGGIMIASSILMGRALAPVEIALGTWKQLVAARQGITRLRDILQGDRAASGAAGRCCRVRAANCRCRISRWRAPGIDMPIVSGVTFSLKAGIGAGATGRQRIGQDLALEGAGRNLAGASRRRAARRRRARSMAQRGSRPAYRLSAAGCRPVRRHRGGEHLPLRRSTQRPDAILKAAQIAGVHDIILRLPDGLRDANRAGRHVAVGGPAAASWAGARRCSAIRSCSCSMSPTPIWMPTARTRLTRAIEIMRQNKSIVVVHLASPERARRARHDDGALRRQGDRVRPEREKCLRASATPAGKGAPGSHAARRRRQGRTARRQLPRVFHHERFDHVHADERMCAPPRPAERMTTSSAPQGAGA